eukprot:82450-Chlamydomonas_euryale.AAC.3
MGPDVLISAHGGGMQRPLRVFEICDRWSCVKRLRGPGCRRLASRILLLRECEVVRRRETS